MAADSKIHTSVPGVQRPRLPTQAYLGFHKRLRHVVLARLAVLAAGAGLAGGRQAVAGGLHLVELRRRLGLVTLPALAAWVQMSYSP